MLFVSIAPAQQAASTTVPSLIRYGGALKDAQGVPLASTATGVTFAVYKQQDGGASVWMETQSVATDASGNYSVLLGSTTANGLPADLFSQEEQRWLGVQVEGQAEQPRVLLVSVPYAFKAHEAETLGGKSVSDFVLANGANSAANGGNANQALPSSANTLATTSGARKGAASAGPTNFSGSTTDQIVGVTQTGAGAGVIASAPTKGVVGTATSTSGTAIGVEGGSSGSGGYGVYGNVTSATGATVGVKGNSQSTSGTGVRGTNIATSGVTAGVSGYVASATGTAGVFNNAAGGNILIGQNNGTTTFTVNGSGNVNAAGGFTGSGAGLTGILFSNLSGTLGNAQFSGTYANPVTLSSSSNSFTGNGAGLTGVLPAGGSSNYIQNTTSPQHANFNITGSGALTGSLSASAGLSGTTASGNGVFGSATATSGTANGVYGETVSNGGAGVYGTATTTTGTAIGVEGGSPSPSAYGVFGVVSSSTGATVGVKGESSSTSGTGVRGTNTATSGSTTGISSNVSSATGTAAVFNNAAGGKIISGQNNGVEQFSVDGSGNVNALGTYTGSGSGLTGVPFSSLSGTLGSAQFSGGYGNAITLSNTSNIYYGNGSNLTGVVVGSGSPFYIQNGTSQQTTANFNISGNGSANSFNSVTTYQVGGSTVLNIGSYADTNLFLGVGAGANNLAGQGQSNVFSGAYAGYQNTSGSSNTFAGYGAGAVNTAGSQNAFFGNLAGNFNTLGTDNAFFGNQAGYSNILGINNAFFGYQAGYSNIGSGSGDGSENTFSGYQAGYSNTASYNTFSGFQAAFSNTLGQGNTFNGYQAGYSNTGGNGNIAIGLSGGLNLTTGNNNIYIGNPACNYPCSESNVIRIGGDVGLGYGPQTAAYMVGIYGVNVGGIPVQINSNGQLGAQTSSRRFKEQIADMGDSTSALMKLRPVTFLYKPEYSKSDRTLQYGLVAEEVAKVYPELVAYDKDGQPYTVRYQYLAPMLLNELQKQHAVVSAQQDVIQSQQEQIDDLQQRLSRLESLIEKQ
jgi:hypothetical protein